MRSNADKLSPRQEQILKFVQDYIQKNVHAPSIRDIQTELNISSTSVVAYNIKALQEKGKLERTGKISRGIRLPQSTTLVQPDNGKGFQVPLLGVITAGSPLPNPEDTTTSDHDMVEVPPEVASPDKLKDVFALKVSGQSMIDALIDDGDIVLLRRQETAENGQMVAAWIDDENAVTLKKFYHEGEQIRLQPANETMQPIYARAENVRIQGRVVGVLRSLV
jgi:repressor LexA